MSRYLTKSKFLLGMECPTKLFYSGKSEYANKQIEDPFLTSLADGGFQVGALAKCYFPDGIQIDTQNDAVALQVTEDYLKRDNVTLFEPAFRVGNLFMRADILVKTGNVLEVFEVKAKSCDFDDAGSMTKQNGMPNSIWKKYIDDIAFQKLIIGSAHRELNVQARLMLVDKRVKCATDGLNQKFRLVRVDGRRRVETSPEITDADLAQRLLVSIDVDSVSEKVIGSVVGDRRFDEHVSYLGEKYASDERIPTYPTKVCGDCGYTTKPAPPTDGSLSGFHECWRDTLGWKDDDFNEPTVLDIWYFLKKDAFLKDGKIKFSQISEADLAPAADDKPGLSRTQRQWKQVDMVQRNDPGPWIDRDNISGALESFDYPLHFIDFETSTPAIPFKQGRRPYEGILFQFSHHTMDVDGNIAHAGEFLSTGSGVFPNYDCVRELKRQLENDGGTIFRYHNHENTFLCAVYAQLGKDPDDIADREELRSFIRTITNSTREDDVWQGERSMVDLYKLVERFHYDPGTNGSLSLKYVLPATLNSSDFLKAKYGEAIYGTDEILSRNFAAQRWVDYDQDGRVRDPYSLLPMLFTDEGANDYAALMEMDKIKDGGAAMTAYCKLQFEDIPSEARRGVESALLKYCELDTLAMVMIYEAWKSSL